MPTQSSVFPPPRTESQRALEFRGRRGGSHSCLGSSGGRVDPHGEHRTSPSLLYWVESHEEQAPEPASIWAVPGGHGTHLICLLVPENSPREHSWQAVLLELFW